MITVRRKAVDLTGEVYGKLTVLGPLRRADGRRVWLCRCECGNKKTITTGNLRGGNQVACGCHRTTHGHTRGRQASSEYEAWRAMQKRCLNPRHKSYADYGGRGITICDRWLESFENFLADMGPRPQGTSLERLNNHRGYGPDNCVWATAKQQARNRRNARLLTFAGRTRSVTEWAEEFGIDRRKIAVRLDALGWSVERALTTC